MRVYNIHDVKTQLSRLVEQAARGESFIIAKAGKPMVKGIALDAPEPHQIGRFGFMAGQINVPKDFDRMGKGISKSKKMAKFNLRLGHFTQQLLHIGA